MSLCLFVGVENDFADYLAILSIKKEAKYFVVNHTEYFYYLF